MWLLVELRRWLMSPTIWVVTLISTAMTVLSTFGVVETGAKQIADGITKPELLTELALTMPFGGVLFTTFVGIIVVGNDFDTKFSARLFALNNNIFTLVAVKGTVAIVSSAIIGATTLVVGRIATQMFLDFKNVSFLPQMDTIEWVRGYMLLFASGSLWGVAIGFLFKNTIVAVGVHFIYQTVAEASIIKAFPHFGKLLPGGAQAAMVKDPSLPERLNVLSGIGIFTFWLVALFVISLLLLQNFPQPPVGFLKKNRKN
jgi:hypothetical protein